MQEAQDRPPQTMLNVIKHQGCHEYHCQEVASRHAHSSQTGEAPWCVTQVYLGASYKVQTRPKGTMGTTCITLPFSCHWRSKLMCFFFHCSLPVGGMLGLAQTKMLDSPTQSKG